MTTDARDARSLPEEGFHEIQLSGKQLVFLFMAATVVSVVIFLCGVLVGRGVQPTSAEAAAGPPAMREAGAAEAPAANAPAGDAAAAAPAQAGQAAGAPGGYFDQLMSEQPPAETVKPVEEAPPATPPVASDAKREEPRAASPAPAPAPAAASTATAAGSGFLVQVTALRQRDEAQALAKRLSQKGYQAFVLDPQKGTTPLYRVRVGPYAQRSEAEQAVKRLAKEGKFKPWVSR
jgi:cell division septation protein DedD